MRKLAALLLVAMVALTGCPYETDEPIDTGVYPPLDHLPGKWKMIDKDSNPQYFEMKMGTAKGSIEMFELDSLGKPKDHFTVHLSKLGARIYASLGVYEDGDKPKGYFIYQYREKGNKMIEFRAVKENKNVVGMSQLKEYLLRNENTDTILDRDDFIRMRKM